ncbi:uncharacterized protein ZC262.2-like isoform X1 [Anoplophora glabripennis]|uniref:uncharacterized protein ZC262.2-like isoform X1 n=2 Tax=Anoplophora glabripennis TaxID=217634 RepID=UPI0008757111|nr:uncharacterized protein ZC262.2-like isoform X1 [Anoplophora glabripennis]
MNSLLNYGSDDDCEDSSEEKPMDPHMSGRNYRKPWLLKQDDANYDEVQMSLSEDSNDESKTPREQQRRQQQSRGDETRRDFARKWDVRDSPKSRDEARSHKERKDERYASKNEKEDDRSKQREGSKEDERTRDRYRSEKDDERSRDRRDERRGKSRERYNRDDRYRKDRDRRRSRSPRERDRKRSRSPRRDRSRSRSRDRGGRGGYSKRYDRGNKERFDRTDQQKNEEKNENKDRFFVPGITGRFREQIEKRKLLWQKKEPEAQLPAAGPQNPIAGGSRITKVWEATTFAQDTDGKVANKFKRLMGIRSVGEGSNVGTDVLKKQEEMFSSMEQQYEVARTATHTMRGVGLGFGSYQR